MRRWLVAFALAVGAALPAQEEISLVCQIDGRPIAKLDAFYANGASVPGGLAFVRVDVHNVDGVEHTCDVVLASRSWDGADVRVTQRLQLGAQERGRVFLPVPTPMRVNEVRLRVDGTTEQRHLNLSQLDAAVALAVLSRPDLEAAALPVVRTWPTEFKNPTRLLQVAVEDLPTDWRMFTGFHCVMVDGRAPVGEAVQEALRRYVFAGGLVIVADGQRLAAGALRSLAKGASLARLNHGLGFAVFCGQLGGDTLELQRLVGHSTPFGIGPLPTAPALHRAQMVPGLGQVRVTVFLAIILLFAIAVGPVNFLWLRRRRRPLLALVTVPALGFGTTAVILAYGFFNDGFGVRGTVTSWTFVDQQRHEAVTFAARTLFSGLAPGSLAMGADSIVLAPRANLGTERIDRWHFDPTTQRLDGGALPSRVPTPLVGVQQGLMRQRLVVRFADQTAQVLVDGGLQPVGTVVLRDHDGALWSGDAPTLRRVAESECQAALTALQRDGSSLLLDASPPRQRLRRGRFMRVETDAEPTGEVGIGAVGTRLFDALLPGEFVTRTATAPWLDEHGIEVAYDGQLHFVRGRLSHEDCLR